MAKHTVHVTVTMSVEIDDEDLKVRVGSCAKKHVIQEAINKASLKDVFETKASIFQSYEEYKRPVRKGIGSY